MDTDKHRLKIYIKTKKYKAKDWHRGEKEGKEKAKDYHRGKREGKRGD